MDNPPPGGLRILIADLLIIAFVIGLLYLETNGVFKFSVEFSMLIIGSGIISIILVNYVIGIKFRKRKLDFRNTFRALGVGFLVFGIILFTIIFTDKDVASGSIVCAGPFILIGATFLVIDIIKKNNPLK
jgi:hypothetical protein